MSNNHIFELDRFAKMFKALANPNRLKIYIRLVSCCGPGTVCSLEEKDERPTVGELCDETCVGVSTVSHHLKELSNSGLIRMERKGQRVLCWADPEVFQEIAKFFSI